MKKTITEDIKFQGKSWLTIPNTTLSTLFSKFLFTADERHYHTHTHARTHARTHTRTHARTHTHTHTNTWDEPAKTISTRTIKNLYQGEKDNRGIKLNKVKYWFTGPNANYSKLFSRFHLLTVGGKHYFLLSGRHKIVSTQIHLKDVLR